MYLRGFFRVLVVVVVVFLVFFIFVVRFGFVVVCPLLECEYEDEKSLKGNIAVSACFEFLTELKVFLEDHYTDFSNQEVARAYWGKVFGFSC